MFPPPVCPTAPLSFHRVHVVYLEILLAYLEVLVAYLEVLLAYLGVLAAYWEVLVLPVNQLSTNQDLAGQLW